MPCKAFNLIGNLLLFPVCNPLKSMLYKTAQVFPNLLCISLSFPFTSTRLQVIHLQFVLKLQGILSARFVEHQHMGTSQQK